MDTASSDDEESNNNSDSDNIFVLKQATMKRLDYKSNLFYMHHKTAHAEKTLANNLRTDSRIYNII